MDRKMIFYLLLVGSKPIKIMIRLRLFGILQIVDYRNLFNLIFYHTQLRLSASFATRPVNHVNLYVLALQFLALVKMWKHFFLVSSFNEMC